MSDEEFTPTIKEFLFSWSPFGGLLSIPQTEEESFYFMVRASTLTVPTFVRVGVYMYQGKTFIEAGYAATNTWGAYKLWRDLYYGVRVLSSPVGLVALGGAYAAHHVLTSPPPTDALRSEPGQTSWWRAVAQSIGAGGPGTGSWTP